MGLWRSLSGSAVMRLTSADPCAKLQKLSESGVILYGVCLRDPLTAEFILRRKDMKKADAVMESCGEALERLHYGGAFWRMKSLLRRKLLVAGMLLLAFLAMYLPTRVLFLEVEGNNHVASNLILEAAAHCGIHFGASRAEVRSERVKNMLLEAIPELQWVGVNTAGCTASISVREREENVEEGEKYAVSRIVASCDGIISTLVCTSGNPLCVPGQAVREGQTLISGLTDCGLSIRAERASGEVFAFTNHKIRAVLPRSIAFREGQTGSQRRISIIIGKKRINLWKDSGISDASCVKIYEEKWVCLPGGFRLPVKLAVEKWIYHDLSEGEMEGEQVLQRFCGDYLQSRMLSGSILKREEIFTQEEARLVIDGKYECLEMIGRERSEEIVHGKNDGTERQRGTD